MVNRFAKRSLLVCFLAIVLKIFARSQDTSEKLSNCKNLHYRRLRCVWAHESVYHLLQIKRQLADLPIPFPHAIHSASNIHESFKYYIFRLHCIQCDSDSCKNHT